MTYTFQIHGKPKAIKADSMEQALDKIISDHLASFVNRDIYFVMSDDPSAPDDYRLVYGHGLFKQTELVKVKELPEYEGISTSTILLVIGIVALVICAIS